MHGIINLCKLVISLFHQHRLEFTLVFKSNPQQGVDMADIVNVGAAVKDSVSAVLTQGTAPVTLSNLTFTSSNTAVATVASDPANPAGVVITGVAAGTATITATATGTDATGATATGTGTTTVTVSITPDTLVFSLVFASDAPASSAKG
jgi:uncharacterized protein YjdB